MLALVSLPFLLQRGLHYSAVQTGLMITPWPIAITLVSPLAGRLADRYPAGLLGAFGLVVFAAGLLSLALTPSDASVPDIIWRMALAGAGFGLFQSPNNRAMIASTPLARSGGASGMLGTARLLGQTIGAALVAFSLARMPAHGTVLSLYIGVGFALAAAAVSSLRLFDRTGQIAKSET
jgi:DHA2 family multidrug resistance protein-like MFS transporter